MPEPGGIVAIDARNGAVLWRRLGDRLPPPTVTDDLALVVHGAEVTALGTESGEPRWRFRAEGKIGWVPIVADHTVYLTNDAGRVIAA